MDESTYNTEKLWFCKAGLKLPVIIVAIAAVIVAAIAVVIASVKHVYMSLLIILSNFGFVK